MKKILFFLTLLPFVSAASSSPKVNDIIAMYDGGDKFVQAYVRGFATALLWMDIENDSEGKGKMFCMPSQLVIDDQVLINSVKSYLKENPDHNDFSFEAISIQSFKKRFPCK